MRGGDGMRRVLKQRGIKWKYLILVTMTAVIIGLDQLTKYWVVERFKLGETLPIITDYFNLTYVQNKGAAFGLLAQAHPSFRVPFFIIVPLIALGSIAYVFRKISDQDIKMSVALSLVISGALGNLIDRLTLGYVVDFLDFHWKWGYHFPAFNVADSAICVGVGILMLDLLTSDDVAPQQKGSRINASHTH
jgi:signal peptidase II